MCKLPHFTVLLCTFPVSENSNLEIHNEKFSFCQSLRSKRDDFSENTAILVNIGRGINFYV